MADNDFHEEQWVYLGEFPGQTRSRLYTWRTPDGRELTFRKRNGAASAGYIHRATIRYDENNNAIIRGDFLCTTVRADDYDQVYLRAQAAARKIEQGAIASNAKRRAGIDEALMPIVAIAAKTKSTAGRAALVDLVARAIYRA